ncbi:hypothetical protein MAR_027912 [Mya arenaria]|uniref:DDE Tnp4 domain-containing protein n=1 Tax=Mya arenaria TaxID=6604 RepID=A0ABY7DER3_MYAAR|nr:hypothetical protein MAR_027912 [Mya arenaria]
MAAPRRLRMALLEHELAQVRFQYNLVLAAILEAAERERQRARRRERRWWVREFILRRPLFGQYETLMKELETEHAADFKAFLRMEPQMYYELLNRVGPRITKNDAFPLRQYMLKPYPHRHLARDERFFNYRCSRARRVVENAFGILANRFRRLLTTLEMRPSTVTKTVMACMTLHNLMRTRHPNIQNADLDREDEQGQFIAGAWRDQAVLEDVQAAGNGPYIYTSRDIRPGYGRVPVEFRPSIGRCPLHRSATGTILSKALSNIGRSSVGVRPMHGTPADTRPCTGRRVFRCGYDGAAMRELGESPVKFSSEVKISPSCHRCGFKQQTPRMSGRCLAGVRIPIEIWQQFLSYLPIESEATSTTNKQLFKDGLEFTTPHPKLLTADKKYKHNQLPIIQIK